jgi:hypothetical protein
MAEPIYDKSSKWMLEHHGRALALLAGMTDVVSCKSVQSEVVHPRQLPDGLLEVRLRGQRNPVPLLVEFCTYPEQRALEQMVDDLMLVKLERGVLPEGLALILCPKGGYELPEQATFASPLGWSKGSLSWKALPMWTLPAERFLSCPDVGMMPFITLMHFEGLPEPVLRCCRERIDREGGRYRANLLAVTQTMMRLRFPMELLELFGGSQAMIESPLMKEFAAEIAAQVDRKRQWKWVADAIRVRFGPLSDSARATLEGLNDEKKLDALHQFAILCPSMEAFLERLAKETAPSPARRSSRRPRKA